MPFTYPLGVMISQGGGFTGTSQAANVEVSLGDIAVIPAGFLGAETIVQFEIGLRVSLVNSVTARTLRIRLRMGGLTGAVLLDTGALALPVSTLLTASPTIMRGHLTQRTAGVSGSAACTATMPNRFFNTAADKTHPFSLAWALSTYDTTIPQAVTFTVAESVNSVADQVGLESALLTAFTLR
jgi:hypothetical protein